jgi:hypothetical protein
VYHRAIVANDEDRYYASRSSKRDSDRILKILSDKIFQKILLSTIDSAKTVTEICLENNIPFSSTYRKVKNCRKLVLSILRESISIKIEEEELPHTGAK